MKKSVVSFMAIIFATMVVGTSAHADFFWKYGKIKRTLVGQYYAGCMIQLDSVIENDCLSSWVSLDCKGLFYDADAESGRTRFASAMAAAHSDKVVGVQIDSANKVNGYCVARRIDVILQ